MFGKSIKIFLADGSPGGLRHVEIANWSGQAIACPRVSFPELRNWTEALRPGVYFLFESQITDDRNTAYIGESENVFERIKEHDRKKDFWNELVIFTSKDENLTKAHVKFLESRLTKQALLADRYNVENGNNPSEASLPRADIAAMEEFIHNVKMILGTLGHRVLDPIITGTSQLEPGQTKSTGRRLFFSKGGLNAQGIQSEEGFILLKDSEVAIETSISIPGKVKALREKLLLENTLKESEGRYILTKDIIISSSSYAAAVVAGTSRSGPQSWKDENNKTLKQIEEESLE